ncbi:hypothetical protein HHI36_009185 [Cryptolaemus montrouzieri]|uniref:Uncharacterized protein n=1 Tax=Cryptolaemus montrouzieri TaxID=559131 RepID=A0ABD2MVF4_9CUCU
MEQKAFVCSKCASRIKLRSYSLSTSTNESSEDQPMITKHFNQLMKRMSDNFASLNTSYKDLTNNVAEIKTFQTALATEMMSCRALLDQHSISITDHQAQIDSNKSRLDQLG